MSAEKVKETVQEFKQAAARAKEAGFDVIEIHAAHGYLIHEFLSPLSNHRTDEYGGSPENRYRFLREIIDEVKQVWDGPLFVRVSASDYTDKGLDIADHIGFAKWMKEQGVDLIDCSSGALVHADINVFPGYQVSFAEKIREQADMATGAVGMLQTVQWLKKFCKTDVPTSSLSAESFCVIHSLQELLRNSSIQRFRPLFNTKEAGNAHKRYPVEDISFFIFRETIG